MNNILNRKRDQGREKRNSFPIPKVSGYRHGFVLSGELI